MTSNKTDYSKLARWLCLYEAVNIISEKADKIGHKADCLKPIPINKYINDLDTEQTSYFNYGSNDDVYGDYY